jgi:hypothetical protein
METQEWMIDLKQEEIVGSMTKEAEEIMIHMAADEAVNDVTNEIGDIHIICTVYESSPTKMDLSELALATTFSFGWNTTAFTHPA